MAVNHVIINGETVVDLRNDTVTPQTLLSGTTAHNAAGEKIAGSVVIAPASTTTPKALGTANAGSENAYARGDHVHPTDTTRQPKITANGILKGDGAGGVSGGAVEKSELADAVKNSLDKADASVQTTGGTMTGTLKVGSASLSPNGYVQGTWLQTTADNHMAGEATKVATLDGNGWVYYRTVAELLADLGIPDAASIRATTNVYGTTKLSTSITSNSKTTAATPYAVKAALNKAKKYTDDQIKVAINSSY